MPADRYVVIHVPIKDDEEMDRIVIASLLNSRELLTFYGDGDSDDVLDAIETVLDYYGANLYADDGSFVFTEDRDDEPTSVSVVVPQEQP